MACTSGKLACSLLQIAFRPYVVLLTHGGAARDAETVLAAIPMLPAHAYLLLSWQPQQAPLCWNPHTQAVVPVVPLPKGMNLLSQRLAEAVARLWGLPARTCPRSSARTKGRTPNG